MTKDEVEQLISEANGEAQTVEELRQKLAQKDEYIRDLESRISKIKKLSENA